MTGGAFPTPLVSTEWLAAHLDDHNLRILDGSWYLSQTGRNPRSEYSDGHIPGAVFCDLDQISDHATPLPHMLPGPEAFAREAGALGVGDDTAVVVYDTSGLNMSAPRIWWMFRFYGHERVAVLDGGFKKWQAEGRRTERGTVRIEPGRFTVRPGLAQVRTLQQMRENVNRGGEQVLDARSPGRFAGSEPEPRPGLKGGHIPGSLNLPFSQLVQADGTLLPLPVLRSRLERAGIDLDLPVVTTCGSGTSACALLLALDLLGAPSAALYDGSWSEWGSL